MKRFLFLLLLCALLLNLATPVSAAVVEPAQPYFVYINSTYVNLTIDKNTGIASCEADCSANAGVTILIYGTLQQYTNNQWADVKSWTSVGSGYVLMDQQRAVYSGYQYKFNVTFKIYNSAGSLLETYSASKACNYPGT